jgi:hypothetical protein
VALPGCARGPSKDHEQVAPQYEVPAGTWRRVEERILAASVAARGEAEAYALDAMERWVDKVSDRTEEDFIPWFSGYWTQQWLALKMAWYESRQSDERASATQKLAAYLQEQYFSRVLEPVGSEIDPDKVMDRAASLYTRVLSETIQAIPSIYHVPLDKLHSKLEEIPAIASPSIPRGGASLYELIQAEDITRLPAYRMLVGDAQTHHDAGGSAPRRDKMEPVARKIADEFVEKLVLRGSATVAGVAGGIAGVLISAVISGVGAIKHHTDKPALEAQLRERLRSALDEMWYVLVEDPDSGVLAPVDHMSARIENSLSPRSVETPSPLPHWLW